MNSSTLETHHLPAVSVADDHLVLVVVLAGDLGGLTEDLSGSGYFGDKNTEAVQDNTMDLGDIGISPDMISDYLSDYLREVRVLVRWGAHEDEDD